MQIVAKKFHLPDKVSYNQDMTQKELLTVAPRLEDQVFEYIICNRETLPAINLEDARKAQRGLYRFKRGEDKLALGNNIEAIERRKRAEEVGFILDKHFGRDLPDGDILEMFYEETRRTVGTERAFHTSNFLS